MKYRFVATLLVVMGLSVLGFLAAMATNPQRAQARIVVSEVHIWNTIGTCPYSNVKITAANVHAFLASSAGHAAVRANRVPDNVYHVMVKQALHPSQHESKMTKNTYFDTMIFCGGGMEYGVIYTGGPTTVFHFSVSWNGKIYQITIPWCGNVAGKVVNAPTFSPKPVPSKIVIVQAAAKAKSNSTSTSTSSSEGCTASASASANAGAWAHATAVGLSWRGAYKVAAHAAAKAAASTTTSTKTKCTPGTVPGTTTVVTTTVATTTESTTTQTTTTTPKPSYSCSVTPIVGKGASWNVVSLNIATNGSSAGPTASEDWGGSGSQTAYGLNPSYTYSSAGTYSIGVTITFNDGASPAHCSTSATVKADNPPPPGGG